MSRLICDDLLDEFVVTATLSDAAAAIMERYGGIATRVVNYFGAPAWSDDPESLARWGDVSRRLKQSAGPA